MLPRKVTRFGNRPNWNTIKNSADTSNTNAIDTPTAFVVSLIEDQLYWVNKNVSGVAMPLAQQLGLGPMSRFRTL